MLRRNVLIFHQAALGDFVLTWPIAIAAARVLAQSRVQYVTGGQKGALVERWVGIESVDVEAGWHALHGDGVKLSEAVVRRLQGLQMAIVFSQKPDVLFLNNIKRIAGDVPVLEISPNPPHGVHVWEHQKKQLQDWPVLYGAVGQVQNLVDAEGAIRTPLAKEESVLIHPGSGSRDKNWALEGFCEVGGLLRDKGKQVKFVLGEVERERFNSSSINKLRDVGEVVMCDTLMSLGDLIASAGGFVGNDSGPTHLAAMMGKPTVGIFGPSSERECWRPRGPRVRVEEFTSTPHEIVEGLLGILGKPEEKISESDDEE